MKFILLSTICVLFLIASCQTDIAEKRIYIKSLQIDSANRIDWYITSLIEGFSRSYILFATKDKEDLIVASHGITNINIDKETKLLLIESTNELENFNDNSTLNFHNGWKAKFNSKGSQMNDGEGRFSRLKLKGVNTTIPHNIDSDF